MVNWEIYNVSSKLQHLNSHAIVTWALGNQRAMLAAAASSGYIITICNLCCQLSTSKVNGEAGKKSQITVLLFLLTIYAVVTLARRPQCYCRVMVWLPMYQLYCRRHSCAS
uniref:Uncharacterized protein n=1 Tax=Micrurus corallinus TaxID=54390 RepID=A0A2D4GYW2_MICCO